MDGFSNLSAMEIDPNGSIQDLLKEHGEGGAAGATAGDGGFGAGGVGGMMQDLAFSVCRSPFFFSFLSPYFPCSWAPYIRNIISGVRKGGRGKGLPLWPKSKKEGNFFWLKTGWLTNEVLI